MRGITPHLDNRYYRDTGREHSVDCSRRGVLRADTLEERMIEMAGSIGLPHEWKMRISQLATATPERNRIDEQRRLLISQQERLQKLFLNGDLAEEEYDRRRLKIQEQLEQLAAQEPTPGIPYEEISKNLRYFLEQATPEESKRVYRARSFVRYMWGRTLSVWNYANLFFHCSITSAAKPSLSSARPSLFRVRVQMLD